ncbi:MAG TPA: hypothetical protein DEF85_06360 [Clostridiaceae bacterium]|jgi:hypothetical protein|nr:hypothetical protein [Clostridiaceae bacterium]HBX48496.1 hypothetical protein [Clostridiaceae bacterium]
MDIKGNSCKDFIFFYYITWVFFSVSKNDMVKNLRNRKLLVLQKSSYKKKIKSLDGVLLTFFDTRMWIKYIKNKGNVDKRENKLGHYLLFIRTWHIFSVLKMVEKKFWEKKKCFY